MTDDKLLYYLAFSYLIGIGPVRFKQLINYFHDPKKAYFASKKDLYNILGPQTALSLIKFRANFEPKKIVDKLNRENIIIIPQYSDLYPKLLKEIADPPIVLYLKGDPEIFIKNQDNFFAIVGSRITSSYGSQTTLTFAHTLASAGLIIISGMAIGIDSYAHYGTLKAGKKTVAVLGCGVNLIYPPQNKDLYQKIITTKGAVISEFPPDKGVLKGLFVARNRIISGIAKGVLIIEGARRSGSLITARYAAQQGRDVFALPGPITSVSSQAPNLLIKQGAKMITEVNDILEEYNLTFNVNNFKNPTVNLDKFSAQEKQIIAYLQNEPLTGDQLACLLNLDINDIFSMVTNLELNKIIAKNNEAKYYLL